MQIVIDIPEEAYKQIMEFGFLENTHGKICYKAIKNGTPISDNEIGEREQMTNVVSREAVIEATHHCGDLQEVRGVVQQLPSVQPSRKGHWIEVAKYSDGKHKIECSECGNHIFDRGHANSHNVKERYKFCPMCGAKMSE